MQQLRAEVISIGDEMTSGVRLDTNSQWLSQRLGELGIVVAFHSTVSDDLDDNVDVFRIAASRVDIVIATGGLGPTADDLTREAIAKMADVELFHAPDVLAHIKQMYETRGREMPPNNRVQSMFPVGSSIIPNPEGTAPGIDFSGTMNNGGDYRIFALPGVPVEMKQMWERSVCPSLQKLAGGAFVIHHHTIHCFGSGESHIETLLPDLVRRGRDPQVGITASAATISLRISTRGPSINECVERMQPTIKTIYESLGELVYGENGIELQQVVADQLTGKKQTLAVIDSGFDGSIAKLISSASGGEDVLIASQVVSENPGNLKELLSQNQLTEQADVVMVIGNINRDSDLVDTGESHYEILIQTADGEHLKQFRYSGHSGWREVRAVKEALNCLRLHLV